MKRVVLFILTVFSLINYAYAQLINDFMNGISIGNSIETYTYTDKKDAIVANKWHLVNYDGLRTDGASPKAVMPLIYTGYVESGKSNAFELPKLTGTNDSRQTGYPLTNTTTYKTGRYYLAFMVNVAEVTTGTGNAFIMFNASHASAYKRMAVYVRNTGGKAQFGLAQTDTGTDLTWITATYDFGATHLLVLKYDFSTSKGALFVNPTIQAAEPTADVTVTNTLADWDTYGIRAITVRQRTTHSQKIGGLRFAKTWANVLGINVDDDGQPHPTGSYDYSAIALHPRLLMNKNEELLLKENLQHNSDLLAVHQAIIGVANATLGREPVERTLEGKRLLTVSRTALYRIFYLSYAYRMTLNYSYLERAERELLAVCNFSDWNPSHFLDVGEMSMAVAIGYDWLFHELQPETKEQIRTALLQKAFLPSKDSQYNFFLTNRANWNQVCNGGLTYAALAIYEGEKTASVEMIERALTSVQLPLTDYGPDGNYTEGYMYWAYGTSFQVMMLAALESALGDDKNLHLTPGFMKTAEYMLFMSGTQGKSFNYSDSRESETPLPAMFWFAKKSNDPSLLYIEKQKIQNGGDYIKSFSENRLLPALMVFANYPSFAHSQKPQNKMWVGHGKTPVALVHTNWGEPTDKYLGVKGGKASNSHGHMDAGSFVYEAYGERWAMDFGMQTYLPLETYGIDLWNMTQNSQRWDVFRYHNKAHNTLTINDGRHLVNETATISRIYDTDAKRGAEIDMTSVLGNNLESALRTVTLINEDYLEVKDSVKTGNNTPKLRWSMVTSAIPVIEDSNTFKLEKDGKTIYLKVESARAFTLKTWSTEPTTDYDEENPGTIIVGFESDLPPNQTSVFTVKLQEIEVLPVSELSFSTKRIPAGVCFSWSTTASKNADSFMVERLNADGSVQDIVAAVNYSDQQKIYTATDKNVVAGKTYYYRLKMVDANGKTIYSDIKSALFDIDTNNRFSVFPNPVEDKLMIKGLPVNSSTIIITDITGKTVYKQSTQENREEITIEVSHLLKGYYTVQIIDSGTVISTTKFLKL